jgi:hypothetical protein
VSHGPWPRQPRSGCSSNLARRVLRSLGGDTWYEVECRQCNGSWSSVAAFASGTQANNMVDNLNNDVFSRPGADLDFIHVHRYPNGQYAVVWAGVTWCNNHSCSTTLCNTSRKTYERLYLAGAITNIKRVTDEDVSFYGRPAWRIAYIWVRNIKNAINGWNATKGAENIPLFGSGFIIPPPTQGTWSGGARTRAASRYGYSECQPNITVATGAEIFHTMDLVIARPSDTSWSLNQWMKVTYAGKSIRARLVDVSGTTKVDLSRGVATYLEFPGSGNVTIDDP